MDTGALPAYAALGVFVCGICGGFAVCADCGDFGRAGQCVFAHGDWDVVFVGGYFVLHGRVFGFGGVGGVVVEMVSGQFGAKEKKVKKEIMMLEKLCNFGII